MFNFKRKKKSVIYNWGISYLLIILIPVISFVIVYNITRDVIEAEISSSNELVISKIRDNIDNTLTDVQRFSAEVCSNQYILNVSGLKGIDDELSYYTMYKAGQELNRYKIFNNSVARFYIYFNNVKRVIAPNTVYKADLFFKTNLEADGYEMKEWLDVVEKSHRGEYFSMSMKDSLIGDLKLVGYVMSLSFPTINKYPANLVVLLNFNEIIPKSEQNNIYLQDRSLIIMDSNGGIVADSGKSMDLSELNYDEMTGDYGRITKDLGGNKVIVSYTTSKVNSWKCIAITPEAVFWQKEQYIRNIMVGGIVLCIFLGSLISFYYLRKNYNPLREVVSYFQDKIHSSNDGKSNEYGFIKQAFSETLNQKETMWERLEQQNKALKSNFIASLLKGRNLIAPVEELIEKYGLTFKYTQYTVIGIYIDNINEEFWDNYEGVNDKYSMSQFIVTNIVEELMNEKFCAYVTEVDDMLACLINTDKNTQTYKEEIHYFIDKAKSFIEQNYKIDLIFSVGSLHEGLDGVQQAFVEAVNALEYARVIGSNNTTFYEVIARESGGYYYYPVEKEYQLSNCIKSADFAAAAVILEEIFDKNFVNSTPSPGITECLMFDLMSTVLKTLNGLEATEGNTIIERNNPINELLKCKTYLEMKNKMLQIIEGICNDMVRNNVQTDYSVRDIVFKLVTDNFSNQNMGIQSIADVIGKHPYYISRIFKEQTDEGIMEYINRIRIEKAKELLKETTWNHEEIAIKVGYTNVRTFQRAFKKLEGTTPGKLKG